MTSLTNAQQAHLNRFYLAGEFGAVRYSTIHALIHAGCLTERNGRIVITQHGQEYCDRNRDTLPIAPSAYAKGGVE